MIGNVHKKSKTNIEVAVTDHSDNQVQCTMRQNDVKMSQSEQIGNLVTKMIDGINEGKVTIKIEVEFSK